MSTTRPHGEPGLDSVLEERQRLHRTVRRQHDLAVGHVQGVERVEEALLGLVLAYEELYVVEQQHVLVPVDVAELVVVPSRIALM